MGLFPRLRKKKTKVSKIPLELNKLATHEDIAKLDETRRLEKRRQVLSNMSPRLKLKLLRKMQAKKEGQGNGR